MFQRQNFDRPIQLNMPFNILRTILLKFTLGTLVIIILVNMNLIIKNKSKNNLENFNNKEMTAPIYFKNQALLVFDGFSYEYWKESKLIPRSLTKKNHQDFMHLIEIVVKIFALNDVTYMLGII